MAILVDVDPRRTVPPSRPVGRSRRSVAEHLGRYKWLYLLLRRSSLSSSAITIVSGNAITRLSSARIERGARAVAAYVARALRAIRGLDDAAEPMGRAAHTSADQAPPPT